jgi:hypothetical protein
MASLPPVKLIKDVLDGLLGRDVVLAPGEPMVSVDAIGGALAVYIDDRNALQAVAGWNLPAAANVGAAVALVPRAGAEAAIEDQYLPDNLLENLNEVSNVLASIFQIPGNPHLRLHETYCPVAAAPNDAYELLFRLGNRIDLAIDVPSYGTGRFALSMLN